MKVKRRNEEPRIDQSKNASRLIDTIRSGRLSKEDYIKSRLGSLKINENDREAYRKVYTEIYDVIAERKRDKI